MADDNVENMDNVGFHTHDGVDSPKLEPRNLLGFPVQVAAPTHVGKEGEVLYMNDKSSVRRQYVYLNGNWYFVDVGTSRLYVLRAGDSMTGALAMGTNKITGMGDPAADQDAATKAYVDAQSGNLVGEFNGYYVDGLTETVTNATITRGLISTRCNNASGGDWMLESVNFGPKDESANNAWDWDNDIDFTCSVQGDTMSADVGALWGASQFYGLILNTTISAAIGTNGTVWTVANQRHAGFFIARDNKVYASSADGTTTEITDIDSGLTHTNELLYRVNHEAGVADTFYVGGTLKATHSSNIAAGSTTVPGIHFEGVIGTNIANGCNAMIRNNYRLLVT